MSTKSEKFWKRVNKHGSYPPKYTKIITRCWEWTGGTQSKLTIPQVLSIRRKYTRGDWSMRALATHYNVCYQSIFKIIHRQTWMEA